MSADGIQAEHQAVSEGILYHVINHCENTQRWRFISKVYYILGLEIGFCAVVSTVMVFYTPISQILFYSIKVTCTTIFLSAFFLLLLTLYSSLNRPTPIVLGLFTLCASLLLSFFSIALQTKFVPLSLLFTTVAIASVYQYTTWASANRKDFNYLVPLTLTCLSILITKYVVQVLSASLEFISLI